MSIIEDADAIKRLADEILREEEPTFTDASRERFMRLPDVMERTGLSRSFVYKIVNDKTFPAPRKVGRTTVWVESEINQWMLDVCNSGSDEEVVEPPQKDPLYEVTVFYTHDGKIRHMSYKDLTLGDVSTLPEVLSEDVDSMTVRKMRKLL